jgi:hypothetical protein
MIVVLTCMALAFLIPNRKGLYYLSSRRNWISPPPPPQASVPPPPPYGPQWGEHIHLRGSAWGWGDPIPTTGQKLWYSIYYTIPLRSQQF